jgi:hypothetical protein
MKNLSQSGVIRRLKSWGERVEKQLRINQSSNFLHSYNSINHNTDMW